MNPRRYTFPWFLREAAATVFAAAFLIGLLMLGSVFGQVS